jgi:hypothetical protein
MPLPQRGTGASAGGVVAQRVSQATPYAYEALDLLPPGRHVNYVREILVRTTILPPRNEHLESLGPWLERQLANHSAEHARLVRSYAVWYLLHRARRAKRPLGRAGAARIRYRVRIALEFLAWIENRGRTLITIDQGDVDKWLANGTWRQRSAVGCSARASSLSSPAARRHWKASARNGLSWGSEGQRQRRRHGARARCRIRPAGTPAR